MASTPAHAFSLPQDLPRPEDDGACDHLAGASIPSVVLSCTSGEQIDLSSLPGLSIIFLYPRTAAPGGTVPDGWNAIPGARGCTPQACAFRDASDELAKFGVTRLFGASTQSTPYQQELKQRVHLQYDLLSDEKLALTAALKLPTFTYNGDTLTKRVTLAIEDGKIVHVWYPVFPPDESANEVLKWLRQRSARVSQ